MVLVVAEMGNSSSLAIFLDYLLSWHLTAFEFFTWVFAFGFRLSLAEFAINLTVFAFSKAKH